MNVDKSYLLIGFFILDSFIQWIEMFEDHTTELSWYDKDGFFVDMDVGYFFSGLNAFKEYFNKRIMED